MLLTNICTASVTLQLFFWSVFIFSVFGVANTAGAMGPQEDCIKHVNAGRELMGSRINTGRALSEFDKAIEIDPKCADAYNLRSRFYLDVGNFEHALSDMDAAACLNPAVYGGESYKKARTKTKASLHMKLGTAYLSRAQPVHTPELLTPSIFEPSDLYEQAIGEFTIVLAITPKDCDAWFFRSEAYSQLHLYEEALSDINRCLSIRPEPRSFVARAKLHLQQQRSDAALTDLQIALREQPDNLEAMTLRSKAAAHSGKIAMAIADLDVVIRKSDSYLAHFDRAALRLKSGDKSGAIADLQAVARSCEQSGIESSALYKQVIQRLTNLGVTRGRGERAHFEPRAGQI